MPNPLLFAWSPLVGLLLAIFFWGSSFAVMKFALETFDPFLVAFGRLFIASLVFLAGWRWVGAIHYHPGDWKWLTAMAFFEPFLYFVCETHALQLTSSAAAATIIALLPLVVAVAARFMLHEALTARTVIGMIVALLGVLLLTWSGEINDKAPNPLLGNLLEVLAMLAAVGYTLLVKVLSQRYSAVFLTAMQSFIGSALYLPFLLLPSTRSVESFSWPAVWAVIHLGVVVSVVAYILFNHALSKMTVTRVMIFTSLIPVFAAFFGWTLFAETINAKQAIAIAMVVAGVFYAQNNGPAVLTRTEP